MIIYTLGKKLLQTAGDSFDLGGIAGSSVIGSVLELDTEPQIVPDEQVSTLYGSRSQWMCVWMCKCDVVLYGALSDQ